MIEANGDADIINENFTEFSTIGNHEREISSTQTNLPLGI